MKRQTKWLFAALFVLMGVFLMPKAGTEVQAAASINYSSLELKQGKTAKLKIRDSSAKVQWTSNKPNVVTVNAKGRITAVKGGTAIITAQTKKKQFTCKVKVVGLKASTLTLNKGTTYTQKVKNAQAVSWSSNNEKVVKVTKKGIVKAKKNGKVVIKCKTTEGTVKCKVYVASLATESLRLPVGSQYQMAVYNTGDLCYWYSADPTVASVDANGVITANGYGGTTTITCKTGKATLTCMVKAVAPGNITTPMSMLPLSSPGARLNVTVESYPNQRTYTVYHQASDENKTSGDNGVYANYMPTHGCAACAVSTVLSGYTGYQWGPAYMTEVVERNLFGTEWVENYSKGHNKQMPVSLYGITKILESNGIPTQYVRQYDDQAAVVQQITDHLRTGNAVVIEVQKIGDNTKWSNSNHTMVLLGMTDSGLAIVADSADRAASFGDQRRIKYATVTELVQYMFPCTVADATDVYFKQASGGGYVLVNPQ